MKSLMFLLVLAGLLGCNGASEKDREDDPGTTTSAVNEEQSTGSLQAIKLSPGQVPKTIKFRGNLFEAWSWSDSLGENILLTSFLPPTPDKNTTPGEEETRTAELHAFHFVKKTGDHQLLWKLSDMEKGCGFDITAEFLPGSIIITDLDNDGTAETSLQYKLACRSDVSPAYMKLVMHEGDAKYVLKGNMWTRASETDSFTVTEENVDLEKLPIKKDEYDQLMQSFGRYETAKSFEKAPPAFLVNARKQWMKFVKESFE